MPSTRAHCPETRVNAREPHECAPARARARSKPSVSAAVRVANGDGRRRAPGAERRQNCLRRRGRRSRSWFTPRRSSWAAPDSVRRREERAAPGPSAALVQPFGGRSRSRLRLSPAAAPGELPSCCCLFPAEPQKLGPPPPQQVRAKRRWSAAGARAAPQSPQGRVGEAWVGRGALRCGEGGELTAGGSGLRGTRRWGTAADSAALPGGGCCERGALVLCVMAVARASGVARRPVYPPDAAFALAGRAAARLGGDEKRTLRAQGAAAAAAAFNPSLARVPPPFGRAVQGQKNGEN